MKRLIVLLFALLPMLVSAQMLTPFCHKNGKWGYEGYVKGKMKAVIKPKFESARKFQGSYAFVRYKGLWGIIGKDGKLVVKPKYSSVSEPYDGVTIVTLGGKYGLVKDSKEVLRIEYESVATYENGYKLKNKGLYGLADASGEVFIPVEYEDIVTYNGGYKIRSKGLYGLTDTSGKIIIPVKYNNITTCDNGYKLIANGCVGLADASGKIFIPVEYEEIVDYNGGYKLKVNGCLGLADASGKIIIPVKYNSITACDNGYKLTANGKVCITDKYGKIKYRDISHLQDGIYVGYSDKLEFLNSNGETVEQPGNVLLYTSTDGKIVERSKDSYNGQYYWNVDMKSNTYHNGQCIMVFDKPITEIGEHAFENCTGLTSITIPNSVTYIGSSAFSGCTSLPVIGGIRYAGSYLLEVVDKTRLSYTIKQGTRFIGDGAFSDCKSLISLAIPNSVTYIGSEAFYGCENIKSVYISDLKVWCQIDFGYNPDMEGPYRNPMFFGAKLYLNNREVSDLIIPSGITAIKDNAFYGCSSLRRVVIPNSVKVISWNAFRDCKNLAEVIIPNDIEKISPDAFYGCSSLPAIGNIRYAGCCLVEVADKNQTSYTIRAGTRVIGERAFKDCRQLERINIPSTVTIMGECAFENCTSLKSFYCKPLTPPTIYGGGEGWYADIWQWVEYGQDFSYLSTTIYVPRASEQLYKEAFMWNIRSGNIVGYDF